MTSLACPRHPSAREAERCDSSISIAQHLLLDFARRRLPSGSWPAGPVVLGGQPWTNGNVLDADPAARALGVRRGMPLGSAHRLAPEATFLDADPEADRAELEAAFERLAEFSPAIAGTSEPADVAFGLLEAQVDGLEGLWGPEPALVERVGAALEPAAGRARHGRGSPARASRRPWRPSPPSPARSISVPPGAEATFLAPLPASLLTPDGEIRARLRRFGLRRIGQVAELAASALVARFGEEGARIGSRSRGEEVDPFRPRRAPERLVTRAAHRARRRRAGGDPVRAPAPRRGARREPGRPRPRRRAGPAAPRAGSRLRPAGTPPELAVETRFPEPTADAEAIERLLLARLERTPPAGRRRPPGAGALRREPGGRPAAPAVRAPGAARRAARLAAGAPRPDLRRGSDPARRDHRPGGAAARAPLGLARR